MPPDDDDAHEAQAIAALMERHRIGACTIETGGRVLSIRRPDGRPAQINRSVRPAVSERRVPGGEASPAKDLVIAAAHFGSFRSIDDTEKLPRLIEAGDIIGIIAAGPLLRPVAAPESGVLLRRLATPGHILNFGDPAFVYRRR